MANIFFTSALSRRLSFLRGMAAGTKTMAGEYKRKPPVGIEEEQEYAEGRYYPNQNKPTRVTVEITLGIYRQGNIKLDVMVVATRCVLVASNTVMLPLCLSCFYMAFFSGDTISRSVIVSYPDKTFRLLNNHVP